MNILYSAIIYDHEVVPHPRLPKSKVGMRLSKRAQSYYNSRDFLAIALRERQLRSNGKPITVPVKLRARIGLSHGRKCDWDNLGKTISDALQVAKIITDDSLIEDGRVIVKRRAKRPFIAITIYDIGENGDGEE